MATNFRSTPIAAALNVEEWGDGTPVARCTDAARRPRWRTDLRVEVMGLEPTASSMRPKRSSQLSYTPEGTATLARAHLGSERRGGQLP